MDRPSRAGLLKAFLKIKWQDSNYPQEEGGVGSCRGAIRGISEALKTSWIWLLVVRVHSLWKFIRLKNYYFCICLKEYFNKRFKNNYNKKIPPKTQINCLQTDHKKNVININWNDFPSHAIHAFLNHRETWNFVQQSFFCMSANEYISSFLILLNYIFFIQKHTVLIYKMTSKWMMIVFACPPA